VQQYNQTGVSWPTGCA